MQLIKIIRALVIPMVLNLRVSGTQLLPGSGVWEADGEEEKEREVERIASRPASVPIRELEPHGSGRPSSPIPHGHTTEKANLAIVKQEEESLWSRIKTTVKGWGSAIMNAFTRAPKPSPSAVKAQSSVEGPSWINRQGTKIARAWKGLKTSMSKKSTGNAAAETAGTPHDLIVTSGTNGATDPRLPETSDTAMDDPDVPPPGPLVPRRGLHGYRALDGNAMVLNRDVGLVSQDRDAAVSQIRRLANGHRDHGRFPAERRIIAETWEPVITAALARVSRSPPLSIERIFVPLHATGTVRRLPRRTSGGHFVPLQVRISPNNANLFVLDMSFSTVISEKGDGKPSISIQDTVDMSEDPLIAPASPEIHLPLVLIVAHRVTQLKNGHLQIEGLIPTRIVMSDNSAGMTTPLPAVAVFAEVTPEGLAPVYAFPAQVDNRGGVRFIQDPKALPSALRAITRSARTDFAEGIPLPIQHGSLLADIVQLGGGVHSSHTFSSNGGRVGHLPLLDGPPYGASTDSGSEVGVGGVASATADDSDQLLDAGRPAVAASGGTVVGSLGGATERRAAGAVTAAGTASGDGSGVSGVKGGAGWDDSSMGDKVFGTGIMGGLRRLFDWLGPDI